MCYSISIHLESPLKSSSVANTVFSSSAITLDLAFNWIKQRFEVILCRWIVEWILVWISIVKCTLKSILKKAHVMIWNACRCKTWHVFHRSQKQFVHKWKALSDSFKWLKWHVMVCFKPQVQPPIQIEKHPTMAVLWDPRCTLHKDRAKLSVRW